MELTSLGYQTDLALLQQGGTNVEDRGDHLVVRSPHNPSHWWGNFLLLAQVPSLELCQSWLDRFAEEFPVAGHGSWFGAFMHRRLVAQLGLVSAGGGLARFQAVETDPDFRRRGLAGSLVQYASTYGFDELGAHTLVMVADPKYFAIDLYRSLGFEATETQLQVERPPGA